MSRFGMARIRKSTVYETDRQPPLASQGLASLALPISHCLTLPAMEQEGIRASSAACFCK
jgi:hypothetical protein